ncbi:MAG: histidine kinase [Pseudonocardiales bacterium]|nr:histidine kinase [Pseudonocardiales bacterium]
MTSRVTGKPRRMPRPELSVRRSIIALVVTAGIAFGVVATGSLLLARRVARSEELDTARRNATVIGNTVFAPVLPAAIRGDAGAISFLDRAVRIRSHDGVLVKVKVWTRDETVIYSDDHALVGRNFAGSNPEVVDAIDDGATTVGVSHLSDAENINEKLTFDHLVEAYVPLKLDDGTIVAFETYSTDVRLRAAQSRLTGALVPLAFASLLVLLLTQLPVSVWLVRRVGRAQQERARLLAGSLAASSRERRNIAHDLHDGVIQDLAGAGYALGALVRVMPGSYPLEARELLDKSCAAVERSVHDLRALIIDIHPPDLTAPGLDLALRDLAERLRASDSVELDVRVELPESVGPGVAETVYRAAREFLVNVAKHAAARHVTVELMGDTETVRLSVIDDGRGLPSDGWDRRADGHLGLVLIADAARDLGGELTVLPGVTGGTVAVLVLPTQGSERD